MHATVLNIVAKIKTSVVLPSQLEDFIVTEGDTLPANIVVDDPHISLYCLHDATRRAIFVDTPPSVDLGRAPFYYDAQYRNARRLLAIPYETLHHLAGNIGGRDLVLVYSVGRCGSTLISQALGTLEGVLSLSEPDIYTQIHMMRFLDKSRDSEYTQLLSSCTRILGTHTPVLVLKFRGMCIFIADLLYQVFPTAKHLFLYRHAQTWARSMNLESIPVADRKAPSVDVPLQRRSIAPLSIPFARRHEREATPVEMTALMWLSMMDRYLTLHTNGMPFLAIRYEDIQTHPKRVLAAVLDYCELPVAQLDVAYAVFAKDSQYGTALSRASRQRQVFPPLDQEDLSQILTVLKEHPVIRMPDYVVPDTVSFRDG